MKTTLHFNTTFAFAILLLASLTLIVPVSAQDDVGGSTIYFLGNADLNSDGLIDTNDPLGLYRGHPGTEAVKVSAVGHNVTQFSASADDAYVGYLVRASGGFGVNVLNANNVLVVSANLLGQTPVSIDTFDDAVWVVGINASQIPVLTGFSIANGAQIAQHTFRRPNTSVSVHSSGDYVLAYNAETGGLSVLRLPSLELVQFPLTGYAATPPLWSPTEPAFIMGVSPDTAQTSVDVALVDVSTGVTTTLYQPDFTTAAPLQLAWSATGAYAIVSRPASAAEPGSGLRIVNVATGAVNRLEQPGNSLNIVTWSGSDAYLLLSSQPADPTSPPILTLYTLDSETGVAVDGFIDYTLGTVIFEGGDVTEPRLAAMGQSRSSGQYSLVIAEQVSGNVTALFEGIDTSLLVSPLVWSSDGTHIFFVANSNDAVFTSLGTPTALYAIDVTEEGGSVERISPENVVVDTLVLQTR